LATAAKEACTRPVSGLITVAIRSNRHAIVRVTRDQVRLIGRAAQPASPPAGVGQRPDQEMRRTDDLRSAIRSFLTDGPGTGPLHRALTSSHRS
jgi:hypothetical protein